MSQGAFEVVKKLRKAGFETYIAGGAVRDALLKRKIQDIDIATAARPAQVKKLFAKTIPTGEKHGTITVRLNDTNYEVTTFRSESAYEGHRRPKAVKFIASGEKDAQRRDFTINALFFDLQAGEIIDYAEGINDLKRRQIRLVGNPDARLKEDALRLARAVRFATILNFKLEREARGAIERNAKLITKISAERVKQELDKIIMSDKPSVGIGLLDVVGLLKYILPELKACQDVTQPSDTHSEGDVYAHSLLALENSPQDADLPTRYAILFHDVGKPQTRSVKNGKIIFYGHNETGAEIAKKICKRLKFSGAESDKIAWLVKNHMVLFEIDKMKLSTRRKWALTPYFADLLRLNTADSAAGLRPSGKAFNNSKILKLGQAALKEIKLTPSLSKPIVSGNDVMKILKIKPGPQVGKILKHLEEKKLANKIKTKDEALKYLKRKRNYFLKVRSTT